MFVKTIDFGEEIEVGRTVFDGVRDGSIKLRPGQWIKLPWCEKMARWCGRTDGGILVVQHYDGDYCHERFSLLVKYWRLGTKDA